MKPSRLTNLIFVPEIQKVVHLLIIRNALKTNAYYRNLPYISWYAFQIDIT